MKATIEFDLPAEHDAYLDAVNGSRWKEVIRSFEWHLIVLRDTEENLDLRQAYDNMHRTLREDRQAAGLAYATVKSLKKNQSRSDEFWAKHLDEYLKKQGIPQMMAEYEKGNPPHKKQKVMKADKNKGTKSNLPNKHQ